LLDLERTRLSSGSLRLKLAGILAMARHREEEKWLAEMTEHSDALDLEADIFARLDAGCHSERRGEGGVAGFAPSGHPG